MCYPIGMEAQRLYWDAIAGTYRAITRIDPDDFQPDTPPDYIW